MDVHASDVEWQTHIVVLLLLLRLQVQSSDVVLDITVEHRLPELHGGPHHVLLYTAVSKLSNASAQFLSDQEKKKEVLHMNLLNLDRNKNLLHRKKAWTLKGLVSFVWVVGLN